MSATYERRLGFLAILVACGMAAVLVKLFQLQVVDGRRWAEEADALVTREISVPAARGRILDARGRVLAEDAPAFDLVLVRRELPPEPRDYALWEPLAAALGTTVDDLVAAVAAHERAIERNVERAVAGVLSRRRREDLRRDHESRPRVLRRDVPYEAVREVELNPARNAGFRARVSRRRRYPGGSDFVHVVGRAGPDAASSSHVERCLFDALSGEEGAVVLRRDRGRRGAFTEEVDEKPARPGRDVVLTVDADDQRAAMEALGAERGAFVVVDADTGAVLAIASSPAYAPEDFARVYAEWTAPDAPSESSPLYDLACWGFHAPGSVLKPVTALAALLEGGLDPGERVHCDRYFRIGDRVLDVLKCNGVHGDVDLHDAIARSCNIYFQTLMTRVEFGAFVRAGRRLGFGTPTGLEFELEGRYGTFAAEADDKRAWPRDSRIAAGIGQGSVVVSPAQVARAYAALATGRLPRLHVVRSVGGVATEPVAEPLGVPLAALERLRAALRAVAEPGGTAAGFGLRVYEAALKTGTAQVGRGDLHNAWIAGFAPARGRRPRVAFAIALLGTDLHGAEACGPRLKRFFDLFYAEGS